MNRLTATDPAAAPHAPLANAGEVDSAIVAAFGPAAADDVAPEGHGDSNWAADRRRYPRRVFLREQSIWAVWVYRFGRRNDRRPAGLVRRLRDRIYRVAFKVVETLTGISLPKSTQVGPGLRIHHFGNIFVDPGVRIGANCTLRQGVTIGAGPGDGRVPVLDDDVDVGPYAQILGGVRVGRGARIGAMSVVLDDVPPGATVAGNPARL